jgi:hypothetical protein
MKRLEVTYIACFLDPQNSKKDVRAQVWETFLNDGGFFIHIIP